MSIYEKPSYLGNTHIYVVFKNPMPWRSNSVLNLDDTRVCGWLTVLCAPPGTAVPAALCWSPWCNATGSGLWPGSRPGSHRTSSPSSAWPPMSSPPLCLSTTARLPPSRSATPSIERLPQSKWWKSWCFEGAVFKLTVLVVD